MHYIQQQCPVMQLTTSSTTVLSPEIADLQLLQSHFVFFFSILSASGPYFNLLMMSLSDVRHV